MVSTSNIALYQKFEILGPTGVIVPSGGPLPEVIDSTAIEIQKYYNEAFRLLGNTNVSGLSQSLDSFNVIVPNAQFANPRFGTLRNLVVGNLNDFLTDELGPQLEALGQTFSAIDVNLPSGVRVSASGNNVVYTTQVLINAGSGRIDDPAIVPSPSSGLVDTQTSINDQSGTLSLISPDESITVSSGVQTLIVSGLFNLASGAIIDGIKSANAQTSINGLSGTVELVSANDGIVISTSGQTIILSGLFTSASGALIDEEEESSGSYPDNHQDSERDETVAINTSTYTEYHSHDTGTLPSGRYRIGWHLVYSNGNTTDEPKYRVQLDNADLVEESREPNHSDGGDYNTFRMHRGGFKYKNLASGSHTIDIDAAREGSATMDVYEARIELWRVALS